MLRSNFESQWTLLRVDWTHVRSVHYQIYFLYNNRHTYNLVSADGQLQEVNTAAVTTDVQFNTVINYVIK
jgi:hypothetical protein